MKVFLGGTCNETDWRQNLKALLNSDIEAFDPVIADREWTEEDRENEIRERSGSDFVVYVLTPRMTGLYSIAEVIDDSNKRVERTILFIQPKDIDYEGKPIIFEESVRKSLEAIAKLAKENGARVFGSLDEIAKFLNNWKF